MKMNTWRRLLHDQSASVAATFALSVIPAMYLVGVGVDYARSAQRQQQLNALADAAALAAVTPSMMAQGDAQAIAAAQNMFNTQASTIPGIAYDPANLSVTVTDAGLSRTVAVSYTAASQNMFAGILGQPTIPISGMSQSTTMVPPNIDFYLLLDNSPSMAVAATTAGINTMVANTPDKCAFACHESDTSPNDYYGLARRLGVTLRIDNLATATQNLMTTAQTTETSTSATYRMAIYTFNYGFNTIASLTSNLNYAKTLAGNIGIYEVPAQNWNNDEITNYDNAMSSINSVLPNPGSGTGTDKPQEVLFFVTDGVEDENVNGARQQSLMDPGWCTIIKNRGIRIAVLYTTYLPLPTNSWYTTYIAPFQPEIGPTLQSCASPGLYFEVNTNQDISSALTTLFDTAVQTAYLNK
jgi:Putative Flp pilus-assembly TadE/G-like